MCNVSQDKNLDPRVRALHEEVGHGVLEERLRAATTIRECERLGMEYHAKCMRLLVDLGGDLLQALATCTSQMPSSDIPLQPISQLPQGHEWYEYGKLARVLNQLRANTDVVMQDLDDTRHNISRKSSKLAVKRAEIEGVELDPEVVENAQDDEDDDIPGMTFGKFSKFLGLN